MDLNTHKGISLSEKSDIVAGAVAVVLYVAALVLLVLYVDISADEEYKQLEKSSGVLISFGNNAPGEGANVSTEETRKKNVLKPEEVVKPVAVENDRAKDAVVEASTKPETVEDKPIIQPDPTEVEVNKGALYRRPTGSKESTTEDLKSHGVSKDRAGKSGSTDGVTTNPGDGGTGANFSLDGRSLIGALAAPEYSERVAGTIVMEIFVDRKGKVTSATYKPRESTISSSSVIEAVRKAALKTQFNADDTATVIQKGTITYILKIE